MCCIVLTLHLMYTNLIKLFIISIVFLSSCKPTSDDNDVVPSAILTEQELENILVDAYLSEGASGINVKGVPGEKFDSTYLFNPLIDHHVEKAKYDSSMVYYTKHPKKLKAIYDKVLDKLSVIQAKGKVQ